MVEHGNQCYDFSIDPNVNNIPWAIARDACQNSGLNMITEGSHGLDNWITDHLYNTGIFSYGYTVNGMWIGYYGKSISVCIHKSGVQLTWVDGFSNPSFLRKFNRNRTLLWSIDISLYMQ